MKMAEEDKQLLLQELEANSYENKRLKNIQDNKIMLAKLMEDLQKVMPQKVSAPPRKERRGRKSHPAADATYVRRNPSRSARFSSLNLSPPRTRSRRGSVSSVLSTASSSASSSPDKLVVRFGFFGRQSDRVETDDESSNSGDFEAKPEIKRPVPVRDDRSAEDITEDDLKMVAEFVSEKKYDSFYGSSCHQCRQKTNDMKTICRSGRCFGVRGQFCGPCLRNRYGENAREALKNPDWECPPCRGICNCSFCRKKQGKTCTGILIHLAREKGFQDVNKYLQSLQKSC